MNFQLHCITGLPRSGSTLLSALLSQNPRFHASMSTPVLHAINSVRDSFNQGDRVADSLVSEKEQVEIYRSIVKGYYHSRIRTKTEIVFDTNRGWTKDLSLLQTISPNAKAIVCIRKLSDILNSFEWQFKRSPVLHPKFFAGPEQWGTVYSRVDAMLQRNGVVGGPWVCLKEGYYGNLSKNMLLIDYEYLVAMPIKVLNCIYEFLEYPFYSKHELENVRLLANELERVEKFDLNLGAPELHRIRTSVAKESKPLLIPPDLIKTADDLNFWSIDRNTSAFFITPSA